MRVSSHTKSQVVGFVGQITGLGLKVSVPVAILSAAFLLITAFGSGIREVDKMSAANRAYFLTCLGTAARLLWVASAVAMGSLAVRCWREEACGQAVTLAGAVVFLGSPFFFAALVVGKVTAPFMSIVGAFRTAGAILLIAGLVLVLQSLILRIWSMISGEERRSAAGSRRSESQNALFRWRCRDIHRCSEALRRVCPAYKVGKSCWRVKGGCLCDIRMLQASRAASGLESVQDGHAQARVPVLTEADKRARCRQCTIYVDHQRQKHRVLSPVVLVLTIGLLYVSYGSMSGWIYRFLEKMDKLMSFFTYSLEGHGSSFADDGHTLTLMAVVCLGIVLVSYAQKALDYLVFELQV